MKNNIYIVESPTQLSSAIEAKSTNAGNNILIVYYNTNDRVTNNTQLNNLLSLRDWKKIYRIRRYSNRYLNHIVMFFYLLIFKITFMNKETKAYIGEYRSFFFCCLARVISRNKETLLEDGTITLTLQKKHFTYGKGMLSFYRDKKTYKLMYIYSKLFSFKIDDIAPDLYSFFDLDKYLIYGQSNFRENDKVISTKKNDSFYFFGSKYSEAGLLSLDTELALLNAAFKYIRSNFQCRVFYIPHRDDSKLKLGSISDFGIEVKYIDGPCEIHFERHNYTPKYIGGFFTTCIYSLPKIYDIEKSISFDIVEYIIKDFDIDEAKCIYSYFKENNINVISLKI